MKLLPLDIDLETKSVLKSLPSAHAALAELKGVASSIPNQIILLNTLVLQEAKDSSAIENIITTHDDLYKSDLNIEHLGSLNAKEVQNYIAALKVGYDLCKDTGVLTNKTILQVQEVLEKNRAGFRKLPGTTLKNSATGEVIYTPPQSLSEINVLMSNLEVFINDNEKCHYDALVKLAIIHFQFESIHPFYDGNGRTGRIINILYLIQQGLLDMPVLYLSNYFIRHKAEYYRLLQSVRESENWEEWILFVVKGIEQTSKDTINLIIQIKALMQQFKHKLRDNYKFYSQDLLNTLFQHPYTKIDFLTRDLNITRITAASYLNKLAGDGMLTKEKVGKNNYFVNHDLFELLRNR